VRLDAHFSRLLDWSLSIQSFVLATPVVRAGFRPRRFSVISSVVDKSTAEGLHELRWVDPALFCVL